MDEFCDVLEIEHSEHGGEDLHPGAEQPSLLTVDDLSLLQLRDVSQVREIIELYSELDISRENVELFKQHLLQRSDSWFVAVGDIGLIYLTNIVPSFTANLQVIFWDQRFGKNRRELVRNVLATGFSEFALTRVTAFIPETNVRLAEVEILKIGFTLEGQLKKAWREKEDCDLLIFGLMRSEVSEWQVVDHLKM